MIRHKHKLIFIQLLNEYKTNYNKLLTGAYQLDPTPVWDSALRLTRNMYQKGQYMCLSFSGPGAILSLGKKLLENMQSSQ